MMYVQRASELFVEKSDAAGKPAELLFGGLALFILFFPYEKAF